MAYRSEPSAMMGESAVEAAPAVAQMPKVAPRDRLKVRIAIAAIVFLALIDLALYMPGMF